MGHECVELRNTAAAVQCYRKYDTIFVPFFPSPLTIHQAHVCLTLFGFPLKFWNERKLATGCDCDDF